ncbi:hypothetical protein XENTR_v10009062 [Xenopus tropicalis]|nr:hypothetical protein XENTR_v10009062 [Xenopus tropicalis]
MNNMKRCWADVQYCWEVNRFPKKLVNSASHSPLVQLSCPMATTNGRYISSSE